jgi:pimeloyl-[acyl-carrier protein] methyl ester esterase
VVVKLPVVLLPGMDGTGLLFDEFVVEAPAQFRPIVLPLPNRGEYDELTELIATTIPSDGPFVVVAESFSGPIGIRLAARFPDRVVGLVLVNSFVTPPRTRWLRWLPWRLIFALPLPRRVVRMFLADKTTPDLIVDRICLAIARTDVSTMSARLRSILSVNEIQNLALVRSPVLLLHGTLDRLIPAEYTEEIARHVRGITARYVVAPHLLLQCRPAEAWNEIDHFMATCLR